VLAPSVWIGKPMSSNCGAQGSPIHAESAAARDFYMHLAEFEESPTDPLHLMLRLEVLGVTLADQAMN
jgi:hypothetical protein